MTSTERTRCPDSQQPLDRRHALGDEHLVALVPAPRRGIGELEVVGEAGISGIVDGLGHGRSLTGLTGRLTAARTSNTCLRTHVPCTSRGRCSALDEPAVDPTFAGVRRIELDDRTWLDHLPGWLAGDEQVFDRLFHELTGSSGPSRCTSAACPSPA